MDIYVVIDREGNVVGVCDDQETAIKMAIKSYEEWAAYLKQTFSITTEIVDKNYAIVRAVGIHLAEGTTIIRYELNVPYEQIT